ncbi:hypothetical protein BC834DRAFT_820923 [Gloeopeniophorella convolvens]|nr:hypothetical protein BC834DRAFT_820923 [Gloeopeniophorella convolvens]
MSSAPYQALPTDDRPDELERAPPRRRHLQEHLQLAQDPRFNPPTPSWWKRALLLLFVIIMFWLSFSLRSSLRTEQPQVMHAKRYSAQHKYRPAASPIITERLKDGRMRVRGAAPTARSR